MRLEKRHGIDRMRDPDGTNVTEFKSISGEFSVTFQSSAWESGQEQEKDSSNPFPV